MNENELYLCPKCKKPYLTEDKAERCCKPQYCSWCGKELKPGKYGLCDECRLKKKSDEEKIRFDYAIKSNYCNVPSEFKEMMYHESYKEGNGFFYEIYEFLDYCVWNDIDIPEYVWGTKSHTLSLDAAQIIEDACDDLYEDAFYRIEQRDIDELQKILDDWCREQYVTTTYEIDYTYAIWTEDRNK